MVILSLDITSESFEINSYDGNYEKKTAYRKGSSQKDILLATKWNFFRHGDNHSYVGGNVAYGEDCRNNLIISKYRYNRLANVRNAFILAEKDYVEISPISDISNAINKGEKSLSNKEIKYNIPRTVFERENLTEKDLEELQKETGQIYGVELSEISMFNSEKINNRLYYLKGIDGKEYVLKFMGRNKKRAELLPKITQSIVNYFPLNFRRKDNGNFTFNVGDELYGLEEFVSGSHQKLRNLKYFSLLGSHMGLLHNHFSNFSSRNNWIEDVLAPTGSSTSESNLISCYFDLAADKTQNTVLLSELEKIIEKDLDNQVSSFPRALIHGDLNNSNLIWQENNPKIVDSETIKYANRLNEFESSLLFGGNMTKPRYIKNSLKVMTCSYNQSSEAPLSNEEIKVLPFLLRFALLRNFVIRKIRRGVNDKYYLGEVMENLRIIEEDSR